MQKALEIVQKLLEDEPRRYLVSAILTPESRRRLLSRIPPEHPVVYADHVTMAYDPLPETLERYRSLEGQRLRIPVTAVAVDAKAQAALVGVDSENEYPHITVSVAEGVEPAYSNTLFEVTDAQHVPIFTLEGIVTLEVLEP